jgi:hypothetical protein
VYPFKPSCSVTVAPPDDVTVSVAGLDVLLAPPLSTATAVSEYVPAGTLLHVTLYGELASLPISVVPAKKSTRETVPSLSLAFALTSTVAGADTVVPFAGLVSVTVGGVLPPPPGLCQPTGLYSHTPASAVAGFQLSNAMNAASSRTNFHLPNTPAE